MDAARIVSLRDCDGLPVGGKAAGLLRLSRLGLCVPAAFVIVGAAAGKLPADLAAAYQALGGGAVAVRSSAAGEDGAGASFAGQFETVLHVVGHDALVAAIEHCLAAASAARVAAYSSQQLAAAGDLAIVVQQMVPSQVAGVVFTKDPLTGQADRIVIEAVSGTGEALVGGHKTPDRYVLTPTGQLLSQELCGDSALLSAQVLTELATQARLAAAGFGLPLDLEWAYDGTADLKWLQARPITVHADELETPVVPADTVYTRYNVGEVLPGAVTPLTWSVVGSCLGNALYRVYSDLGIPLPPADQPVCLGYFHGHVFLNFFLINQVIAYVAGTDRQGAHISLAGRLLPEIAAPPPGPLAMRLRNGVRLMSLLRSAAPLLTKLEQLAQRRVPVVDGTLQSRYAQITQQCAWFNEAWQTHLTVSFASGTANGLLLGVLTGGKEPKAEHHAEVAALLADVGAVEGASMLAELSAVSQTLRADPQRFAALAALSEADALAALGVQTDPGSVRFRQFLTANGHRGIRECELREPDWSEDARPLLRSLRATARHAAPQRDAAPAAAGETLARLSAPARLILKYALPWARRSVGMRERGKSLSVLCLRRLKQSYVALGHELVAQGRLPELDLLYFLSHEEIGKLCDGPQPLLIPIAERRRRRYRQQETLSFAPLSVGRPEPLARTATLADSAELRGTPVSRGVVTGAARVARTLADAADLLPGEVLIVPYTDIGWSPYFRIAGGLATEIGGTLSHGAVVAREYGLPAVVNLPGATAQFRSGEQVLLDGDHGILRRV